MGQKFSDIERQAIAERLWNEHGKAIYRFALRLTGNRSVAEDLTSETILDALEALLKGNENLHRGYLFGITMNRFRRIRRVTLEPIDDLIASDSPNVESLLDLERAYRQLPRPLQEVFVLVKAEGFTAKEAAEILRIPQGTVQGRVHDAVHRMRLSLGSTTQMPPILQQVKP